MLIDGDHFYLQNVADFADVVNLTDVLVVQFTDVTETVAAGQDFDEGPKVLDRRHFALVDLADADFLGKRLYLGLGGFGAGRFHVRYVDGAVVLDVDFGAGRFLNALDRFAAGTDQQADLL